MESTAVFVQGKGASVPITIQSDPTSAARCRSASEVQTIES